MNGKKLSAVREAESAYTPQLARNVASCQAQGKPRKNYAMGGALEMLKGSSGPATRVKSAGAAVTPIVTGAETVLATRYEVAV
jgi:hypothetical protein